MLELDGVEDYQKILFAKKYKHSRPETEKTEWNTIEMTINDPFGNRITFFENI